MIMKLPSEFKTVIANNNGLQQYLSNLLKGHEATPRSWLYEDEDASCVLQRWLDRLSVLENGDSYERNVFQFDTSQLEKWGPQGEVQPISDLLQDVVMPTFSRGSDAPPKAFNTSEWSGALEDTREYLLQYTRALRPASYSSVLDDMRARDTLESNSGWPDFRRRNLPEVKTNAIVAAQNGQWKTYPAIALFRNYNRKTRLVWMFPMAANLVEGSFTQPFQSLLVKSRLPFFAPWEGFEAVRRLITEAYDARRYVAASDFSSTDAHFTLNTTLQVFEVLKHVFQRGVTSRLEESLTRMHTIPLIIGPDSIIEGGHGVSSGSNWTNLIETVFDLILSNFVHRQLPNWTGLYAIGDDMAWITDKYDDAFSQNLEELGLDVGQEINAEKVTNSPDSVKTLQRLFQRGYRRPDGLLRGVYSTIRALKSSIYPERFHKPKDWSSDMFCARQYMILENCVDHPLFEEFVKFVVAGQRDLIPFAKKSDATLRQIHRKSKLLPGLNPTYNQERRDGALPSFESIRIARTL